MKLRRFSSFLSGLGTTALTLAAIHGTIMVGRQAYIDYGWLGLFVILALGVPFFWLIPLVGWWFLPTSDMIWLMVFLGVFLLSSWGADAVKKMATPSGPH